MPLIPKSIFSKSQHYENLGTAKHSFKRWWWLGLSFTATSCKVQKCGGNGIHTFYIYLFISETTKKVGQ